MTTTVSSVLMLDRQTKRLCTAMYPGSPSGHSPVPAAVVCGKHYVDSWYHERVLWGSLPPMLDGLGRCMSDVGDGTPHPQEISAVLNIMTSTRQGKKFQTGGPRKMTGGDSSLCRRACWYGRTLWRSRGGFARALGWRATATLPHGSRQNGWVILQKRGRALLGPTTTTTLGRVGSRQPTSWRGCHDLGRQTLFGLGCHADEHCLDVTCVELRPVPRTSSVSMAPAPRP